MKVTLKEVHDLWVIKNPSGMGWVIQDMDTRLFLNRLSTGGIKFVRYVQYDPKLAKASSEWCNNGTLWPSKEAARSFLDMLIGAVATVNEAEEMATQVLAGAMGMGGMRIYPYRSFLVRPKKQGDWCGLGDWIAEGCGERDFPYQLPKLFTSGPTAEEVVCRIKKMYPIQDIFVDKSHSGLIPVNKQEQSEEIIAAFTSRFGIGDPAILDAQSGPEIVEICSIRFIKNDVLYAYQYPKVKEPRREEISFRHFFLPKDWQEFQQTRLQEDLKKIKQRYQDAVDSVVSEAACESPVVSKDPVKFVCYKVTIPNKEVASLSHTFWVARHADNTTSFDWTWKWEWEFSAISSQKVVDQVMVQYPNAEIRILSPEHVGVKWICYPSTRCQEVRGAKKYVAHREDDRAAINESWAFTANTPKECCAQVKEVYPQATIEVMA